MKKSALYKYWDQSWVMATELFCQIDFKILRNSAILMEAERDHSVGYYLKFTLWSRNYEKYFIIDFFEQFMKNNDFKSLIFQS